MRTGHKGRMRRGKSVRKKLAAVLTAGICFQNIQCALDTEQLGVELFSTIATLFVTDYFYNLFGVSPSPF